MLPIRKLVISQMRIQEKMIYDLKNIVKLTYLTKGLNHHN